MGDSDSSALELDGELIDALRHEPLKPPPEIEAELLRAKLQLHRPAVAASGLEGSGSSHAPQPSFVAADRARLSGAVAGGKQSALTATTSASRVRERYVDTFNIS